MLPVANTLSLFAIGWWFATGFDGLGDFVGRWFVGLMGVYREWSDCRWNGCSRRLIEIYALLRVWMESKILAEGRIWLISPARNNVCFLLSLMVGLDLSVLNLF